MSDFPSSGVVLPQFVHPWTIYGPGADFRLHAAGGSPTTLTWTANLAVYIPITLPFAYPVRRVFWVNGSTVASANCDFGIYSPGGSRIYSTGTTVQAGASAPQYVTPATPFLLDPGNYYFAWVCDSTTSHAFGLAMATSGFGAMAGILSQSLASPLLPATATFATAGVAGGPVVCGVTRTPSGF